MQGLSNHLSTEYLRRKIHFFLRKREKRREKEPSQEEEGSREGKTYTIAAVKVTGMGAGRAQARCWQGTSNLGVQAMETELLKLEYITALNDLSASIRLNISV